MSLFQAMASPFLGGRSGVRVIYSVRVLQDVKDVETPRVLDFKINGRVAFLAATPKLTLKADTSTQLAYTRLHRCTPTHRPPTDLKKRRDATSSK